MKEELLSFCKERNLLLDENLMGIFSNIPNIKVSQILLEKFTSAINKKFITKKIILENESIFMGFLEEISSFFKMDLKIYFSFLNLNKIKGNIKKEETFEESVVVVGDSIVAPGRNLEVKDFVTHFRNRYDFFSKFLSSKPELENLTSISKLNGEKQKISVIGMVLNKSQTKNGNLIVEIEDLSGKMKVIFSSQKEELLKEAEEITLDSVLGFTGFGSRDILFVNNLVFPETKLLERKKGPKEELVLFLGDLHFGSKNFLYKSFDKFLDYLQGNVPNTPEVKKIKYLFFVGDLITGVGNYPNQERDLSTNDLEGQFIALSELFKKIPKHIKIIISPGNHDCVRLMEPQPVLNKTYAWPLYDLENVILTENPARVNIGSTKDFSGFNILTYHGFSFPYYSNSIQSLMKIKAMNDPTKIMKYLLKNRHLAPTHGSTQYFPSKEDNLIIKNVPDIFVAGHTHKSDIVYQDNVLLVSVSSWEGFTPYQEKFGNKPDHCKIPMFNLKTRAVKILDFEIEQDEIKTYVEEKNENWN